MHEWNYHNNDPVRGPSEWARQYPAVGQAQSPIDIRVDYCDLQQHQQQVGCSCDKVLAKRLQQLDRPSKKNRQHHDHLDSTGGDERDYDGDNYGRSPSASSVGSAFSSSDASSQASPQRSQPQHTQHRSRQQYGKNNGRQAATQSTRYCATNKKIFLGYPRYLNAVKLGNTGHAWQIEMPAELAQHTLLCGPPLGDREYRLAQLHCHWGSQCDQGSEHLVNGQAYSAEIHFVHWNCKDFRTFDEAARHKHGLAVLAVFVQALEGDEQNGNKHLEKIVSALPQVSERPHSWVQLRDARLDLKKLFPTNRWLYASYEGSLTTPPLSEVVDWIVFLQPIQCSRRQIEAFRQLKCSPTGERLQRNCRPVQPLNKRLVSIWTHSGH